MFSAPTWELEMLFFWGGGVRGIVHNNIYSCMGNLTIEIWHCLSCN